MTVLLFFLCAPEGSLCTVFHHLIQLAQDIWMRKWATELFGKPQVRNAVIRTYSPCVTRKLIYDSAFHQSFQSRIVIVVRRRFSFSLYRSIFCH